MRRLGKIFILVGAMVLVFYYVYNKSLEYKNNDDIKNYIEETSVIDEIDEPTNSEQELSNIQNTNSNIAYTAVLEIPKLNLKRGVVDSTKNFKSINYAISVDNNSKYPNEKGNFILYSHSGNSSIAFFNRLYKLEINDDVYVYFNGIKYHYNIINIHDIEKTGKAKVINLKDDKYITLITCNQNKKGYQIVIEGKLIDEVNY